MSDARAYAARNRQGSDWFGHGDTGSSAPVATPVKVAPPPSPPAAQNGAGSTPSGRSQMIKPTCNSNQWYKYDQKSPASEATPTKDTPKTKTTRQASGDWYSHSTPKTDEKKDSTKPRVMTTEGESYCRRDKAGTSATWFSHEHAGEATPQGAGPRVTSKEGSGNASRMRGESENWFSHSGAANGAQAPTHVSKGRGVQPKSSEMHHIFHMGTEGK